MYNSQLTIRRLKFAIVPPGRVSDAPSAIVANSPQFCHLEIATQKSLLLVAGKGSASGRSRWIAINPHPVSGTSSPQITRAHPTSSLPKSEPFQLYHDDIYASTQSRRQLSFSWPYLALCLLCLSFADEKCPPLSQPHPRTL